jgi:hypothetical protein
VKARSFTRWLYFDGVDYGAAALAIMLDQRTAPYGVQLLRVSLGLLFWAHKRPSLNC